MGLFDAVQACEQGELGQDTRKSRRIPVAIVNLDGEGRHAIVRGAQALAALGFRLASDGSVYHA